MKSEKTLHEQIEADRNALRTYLRLGYSKKDAMEAFASIFQPEISANPERYEKIKQFIESFESEYDAAKKLEQKWTTTELVTVARALNVLTITTDNSHQRVDLFTYHRNRFFNKTHYIGYTGNIYKVYPKDKNWEAPVEFKKKEKRKHEQE